MVLSKTYLDRLAQPTLSEQTLERLETQRKFALFHVGVEWEKVCAALDLAKGKKPSEETARKS